MRFNLALFALAASTNLVGAAPSTEWSESTIEVRGEDGVSHLVPRIAWNDKTMEAAYKVCTVAGAATYATCRLASGGNVICNTAVGVGIAAAAMEGAVKCSQAVAEWKKKHKQPDAEAGQHLLPLPHPVPAPAPRPVTLPARPVPGPRRKTWRDLSEVEKYSQDDEAAPVRRRQVQEWVA